MKTANIGFALFLTGCATLTIEQIATTSNEKLCNELGFEYSGMSEQTKGQIGDELVRRGAINGYDWSMISQRKVYVGMSELALRCSWGAPDRINQTLTGYGSSKQWVYRYPGYHVDQYNFVYTQGGKVVAIQN
jgi:hypothetical protein